MSEMVAPVFVTPVRGVNRPPTVSIVASGRPLSEGIRLLHNTERYGFLLNKDIEGFGLSPVENTTVEAARGGSTLRHRRWGEGDMFLPVTLASPSPEGMYDMFARLVSVVTNQNDYFDVVFFDPYSQEARRRTVLYDSGLETVNEVSPTLHRVGVTAKFLSPFWRGPERVVTERIAPPVKPLITADPGSPVNRWDDPGFSDSTAYEPWFVVDGGLEKQGTGSEHGLFVAGHRVEVTPGETVSVSADLSFVDGPNVGAIQVRVRAYDADGVLVTGSTQTVISESYAGTYTGTYAVPDTGVEIELGFYTASDVHANTRARIDNLDVKREVQYLAQYEWEGEPHASPSIKRDHTGQIVARNLTHDPEFETVAHGWAVIGASAELITNQPRMWDGRGGRMLQASANDTSTFSVRHPNIPIEPGQWFAWKLLGATERTTDLAQQIWFYGEGGSTGAETEAYRPAPWYDGTELFFVAQAPAGTNRVSPRVYMRPNAAGDRLWLDRVHTAVADTEAEALAQVAAFFDGDTPDVLDEGSREGSYSFPFFPVFLADSTVQGEHELRVEGDAPVWPVWEITGPGRDVEIIGPGSDRIFVSGEVSSPIRIVTEPGKRSISDESGLIWDRMKPGDDEFFALRPGVNNLKMTMVGGNPESTIKAVYAENWKTPRGTAQGMIRGGAA